MVCVQAGEEDAGPSAEVEGGGTERKGEIRVSTARTQRLQPQVHGRHVSSVRQVSRDGDAEVAVLQGNPLLNPQVSQHLPGS